MTIQPNFHWQFNEREGSVAVDSISGVEGRFNSVRPNFHGRIGPAIQARGKKARVVFGDDLGQFGTSDFTIAFGMNLLDTHGQEDLDIIGQRSVSGHGNWFSLRLEDRRRLTFEVDENSKGKHYAIAKTAKVLKAFHWFHVALVRQGRTVKVYVDGVLQAEGESKTGVADIKGSVPVFLGHYRRETPGALYEDLRIYNTALSVAQINNLIPPRNRVLRPGEVELIATGGATVILTDAEANLGRHSQSFKELRVGPGTGTTLYKDANFGGVAQKLYADLPDMRLSKLRAFPKSIHVWSTVGEPFTGKWTVRTATGRYLSRRADALTTAPRRLLDELFTFVYNPHFSELQLVPVTDQEGLLLRIAGESSVLLVDDGEAEQDAFSLFNPLRQEWLKLSDNNRFGWTRDHEQRSLFFRDAKVADNEGQVGELVQGEVALYEHVAYAGRTWILSDNDGAADGNFASLKNFHRLDDVVSSIRMGPDTGVTLFANDKQAVRDDKRETDLEDFVRSVPDLREAQIGNDTISSLRIFKTVAPETIFTSVSSALSQDYRMVDDELEEFSSYRTILRLAAETSTVEVSATDQTVIEVDGEIHEINEITSVTLRPNALKQIMITSEADGISTPGLKFRTDGMVANEQVVIFPDRQAHKQIAELEDDALWNATDAEGKPLVDQNAHTQSEIATVQRTITRAMSNVVYTEDDPANPVTPATPFVAASVKTPSGAGRVASVNRAVSSGGNTNPWAINFRPQAPASRAVAPGGLGRSAAVVAPSDTIWEEAVSQNDFNRLLAQSQISDPGKTVNVVRRGAGLRSIRGFFSGIKDTVKKATSVVVGFVDDVMNVLVDIGERVVKFVLDTAEKVADFVEAVIEKVVESIKQFIEFLRFLFNWDDILETQRFLADTINSAIDSADEMVSAAKEPVSKFVRDTQEALDEGIDSMIRALGVDPDEIEQDSGFELPEAAEWFLNKLLGGSNSSSSSTNPDSSKTTGTAGDSFQQALQSLLAALIDIVEIGGTVFDGMFDTVKALIANPKRPELALAEILDTFRDVGIKALDFGENIVHAFLDLVVTAIRLLRDVLNLEIRIPLISDLFELLGAGKLTILNVTTVLVAIPVTVVSKLMFGEAPFQDTEPEFPKVAEITAQRADVVALSAQGGEVALVQASSVADDGINVDSTRRKIVGFGVLAIVSDVINGIIRTGLDLTPEEFDDDGESTRFLERMSLVLSGFSWLASFPASPVEPGGYPYNLLLDKNRVSKSQHEREYWERVVWGWRTGMLGLDVLYAIAGEFDLAPDQRFKRGDDVTAGLTTLLSLVDVGLTGRYLATIPKEDDRGREIANEVLSRLPDTFAFLRSDRNPQTQFASISALFIINLVATISTTAFSIRFLNASVAELEDR